MDALKYELLLREVLSLMRGDELDYAQRNMEGLAKVDAVQDLLRNALRKSSLGMFNGVPHCFDGRVYSPLSWSDFSNLVYDVMRECRVPFGFYGKTQGIARVCRSVVEGRELRPDNRLMVFSNCVCDTSTGAVHDFGAEWVQVSGVGYRCDPLAKAPVWLQFLEQVLPDPSLRELLQQFLGAVFVDRSEAKIETLMILYGAGSNGKSVVYETVSGLLGRENISNFALSALMDVGERKKNIAFMNGKRLNYCSEIDTVCFGRGSDAVKGLISGEPVEARVNYGDNFTAYNIPLMMANTNRLPKLVDDSWGMRRRLCVIPFYVEIPKERQNTHLAAELRDEYPGIFNWVMEGRRKFVEGGCRLPYSAVAERVMEEYASTGNTVTAFMFAKGYMNASGAAVDIEPAWLNRRDLYASYRRWCFNGKRQIEDEREFSRVLEAAGWEMRRKSDGMAVGVYGAEAVRALRREAAERAATERRRIAMEYEREAARIEAAEKSGAVKPDDAAAELRKAEKMRRYATWTAKSGAKAGITVKDGRRLAKGTVALARYLAVGVSKMEKLMSKGVFDGAYTEGRGCYWFDVDRCIDALRDYDEGRKGVKRDAESVLP